MSRWETGSKRPPPPVLAGYERVLGLPDLSLVAIDRLLRRTALSDPPDDPVRRPADLEAEFDDLFERVDENRDLTGGDWMRMAAGLAQNQNVYLYSSTWAALCRRLVSELTRSSGIAFARRYEAASRLMSHQRASRHLTLCLGEFVMHPDVQNVAPSLTLLREVGDSGGADLVAKLVSSNNALLRRGAGVAAGAMAAQDSFGNEALSALEGYVLHELRRPGKAHQRLDVLDIATHFPSTAFDRLLSRTDPRMQHHLIRARTTGEIAATDTSRMIPDQMATYAEVRLGRNAHDPDQLLRRLLRESLFHVSRERRNLASTLLAISPYAPHLAASALELTQSEQEVTARMAWSLLRRLGHLVTRESVTDFAITQSRSEHLAHGLVTLGLATGPITDATADELLHHVRTTSRDGVRHSALFALGMSGHPHLRQLAARDDASAANARWWLGLGCSLHDMDVQAPIV